MNNQEVILKLWDYKKYFKKYWFKLVLIYFLSILNSSITLLIPITSMLVIDLLKITKSINVIILILIIQTVLSFYSILYSYYEQIISNYCKVNIILNIKKDLVNHIHRLPLEYFTKETPAHLINRITNDVSAFSIFINGSLKKFITNVFSILGIIAITRYLGNEYIFIILISTVVFYILNLNITKQQKELEKDSSINRGNIYNVLYESLSNVDTVKAYKTEELETEKFYNESLKQSELSYRSIKLHFKRSSMNEIIESSVLIFVFGLGGYQVIHGLLSIGGLIALSQYIQQLRAGLNSFSSNYNGFACALGQIERVIEVFDIDTENTVSTPYKIVPNRKDVNIEFKNVTFSYHSGKDLLRNVCFKISKGEKILLIGPSGIGKTTIIKLLLRYIHPSDGSILIGGNNINMIDLEEYRSRFGVVLQDSKCFSGTIRDNITYGLKNICDDEITNAAKLSHIHDFISSLPNKYDSQIFQNYTKLSGGQKQRILLARAIVRKPSILLLDEATNAIDISTNYEIRKIIYNNLPDTTCIIISHDLLMYNDVDRIFEIQDYKIVECTTLNHVE